MENTDEITEDNEIDQDDNMEITQYDENEENMKAIVHKIEVTPPDDEDERNRKKKISISARDNRSLQRGVNSEKQESDNNQSIKHRRAESQKIRRDNNKSKLTEEEIVNHHKQQAESLKIRRDNNKSKLTEEEIVNHHKQQAESLKIRRNNNKSKLTEEEIVHFNKQNAQSQKIRRDINKLKLTEEEIINHHKQEASTKYTIRHQTKQNMTPDEEANHRYERATAEAIRLNRSKQNMTLDEEANHRYERAAAEANRLNVLKQNMTPEEECNHLKQKSTNKKNSRDNIKYRNQNIIYPPESHIPLPTSIPTSMPSDQYFYTFEKNPYAGESFFWARSFNWQFADWINKDFINMPLHEIDILKQAMYSDCNINENVIKNSLQKYYNHMNPTTPCMACSVCGQLDIPIHNNIKNDIPSIMSFTDVSLYDSCLQCLQYSIEDTENYNKNVPDHILDNNDNKLKWQRYKKIISNVQLNFEGK
jgi:hypothetical protein